MSGLEPFQDNAAWRDKLARHLLMDCPIRKNVEKIEMEPEKQRHSYDVVIDFESLIAANRAERQNCEITGNATETLSICEDSVYEQQGPHDDHDESFDAYERMCDKTCSDPDSTLFQYLHSNDKEQVLALAKKRSNTDCSSSSSSKDTSIDKTIDPELVALRRMLDEVCAEQQLENESPLKGVECTQLEDIEVPSRFWDNTIGGNDSVFQPTIETSPVKMVGLLRPSTILEANEADLTSTLSDDSQISFHSALKTQQTSETIASSCYESAANNSIAQTSNEEDKSLVDVDNMFYAEIAKRYPDKPENESDYPLALSGPKDNSSLNAEPVDETVIELSSDEESFNKQLAPVIKLEENNISFDNNKENECDKSLHFDDTIEEMEYMMKKGLEYMAAAVPSKTVPNTEVPKLQKENTFTMSPKMKTTTGSKPPNSKYCTPLRGNNKITVGSSSGKKATTLLPPRFDINMGKPTAKLFKTPSSIPTRRQLEIKQPYGHIISPIRAYTQKSSTAPLMTMFKQKGVDMFTSLAFTELEQESLLCRPKLSMAKGPSSKSKMVTQGIGPEARLLPKKAYISSDMKQIVDERTPMPMPKVKQIQKYLNSAVEPSVLRHDGKIKVLATHTTNVSANNSNIPRRTNLSLADLSLASGDTSMYTIKDAQKF